MQASNGAAILHPAAGTVPVPVREVLGVAQEYLDAGRLDAAGRMLGHVLAADSGHADALHMQGLISHRRGQEPQALALMERAVAAQPHSAMFWRNLSEVSRMHGHADRALVAARRAIALDPADALGLFNLAMVHYDRLEIAGCLAAANACLDLKPGLPQAHMKLAQAHLLAGDLAAGWREYEWRYRIPGAAPLMPANLLTPDRPQWDGSAMPNGRLLLVADQGYGDVIQFARYIPGVLGLCPQVTIATFPELAVLLGQMFPGLNMVSRWEDTPTFAAYCPLSGLPRLRGTVLDSIPDGVPYLAAVPDRAAHWRGVLDGLVPPGLKRIGLSWAGRPTHNNDANRSVALARLAPITDVDGVAFVSLQKGPAAREAEGYRGSAPLIDLDGRTDGFDDTAAIIDGLDLVICVDTAIAHLAGAMGRPAWVMLPYAPDWRWLLDRADTPWYPSLRLFRPAAPRDWPGVAAAVAARLSRLAAA